MAGIGFELKKLFHRRGLMAMLRAYGYAGVICAGPMLLGVLLQFGVLIVSGWWQVGRPDRDLLVCMITYTLLASLVLTSFLSMPVTRFLADMLFDHDEKMILPSFWGSISIMLVVGAVLYTVFLLFSGATLMQGTLCLWLFLEMVVNWNAMSYLTAIKDYKSILYSFAAAVLVAFITSCVLLALALPPVESLLFAVVLGYGVMLVWDVLLLHRYFPQSRENPWLFLQWVDQFLPLALTGLFTTIGLFAHLVITWCGPLGIKVKGLFYGAPYYDVPAMLAFLTILITTVNFVVSVEVNFYPTYRSYYSLLNDGGTVKDITVAENEMLAVLNRELHYTALKQLLVTAAVISLEKTVLNALPLGYFRVLCIGYALYAVGNIVMLILLYFTDYYGALTASALFAGSTVIFTVIGQFFTTTLFGFGFLMGASLFAIYAMFRLASYTDNLPYRVLGQQPIVAQTKRGRFTELGILLEHGEQRIDQSLHHTEHKRHARRECGTNITEANNAIGEES